MLERALALPNRWLLDRVAPRWVDYVVSNTMTDLNRRLNGFVWTYELKGQLVRTVDEAPGVKTFVVRPNQHWRGAKAGQHVELQVPMGGKVLRRRYTVSLQGDGCIHLTVKRQAGSVVSAWLHEHWRPGTSLVMSQAQGRFCHDHAAPAKVLHLCAGSGITPCHAMVSEVLASPDAPRPDIQVIAQFSRAEDVIFKPALKDWARAGLQVSTWLSRPQGRLDGVALMRLCPDVRDRDVYLCGPAEFMRAMLAALQALGVDPARVHTEQFAPVAAACTPPQSGGCGGFQAEGAQVVFKHLNTRITLTAADQGKTLLQLAKEHQVHVESGCEQGMCGTCRVSVHEGQADGNVLGRTVYLCTAYPASKELVLGP